MRSPEQVLRRPLLTEKALRLGEEERKYGFEVLLDANKAEIKRAVEKKFEVEVTGIHVINIKGKRKRMNTRRGITFGKRSDRKKAYVTIKKDQTIDFFGGVRP